MVATELATAGYGGGDGHGWFRDSGPEVEVDVVVSFDPRKSGVLDVGPGSRMVTKTRKCVVLGDGYVCLPGCFLLGSLTGDR